MVQGECEGDEGQGEGEPAHQKILFRVEGQVQVRFWHTLHVVHVLVRIKSAFEFSAKY
jgi:hypothetical protein